MKNTKERKEKTAQRTPTPWKVHKAKFDDIGDYLPIQNGIYEIARVYTPFIPERAENAAFIVRAVNAHDALVEALKYANTYISEELASGSGLDRIHSVFDSISSALKLAEGGKCR